MVTAAALINTLIFLSLAALHVYWALGGQRWMTAVVPVTTGEGKQLFTPGPVITLCVAAGLLLFAFASLAALPCWDWGLGNWIKYSNIAIAFIFALRAIGDFKYAGFFKKVVNTPFASNDTRYYSPLCLLISVLALLLVFLYN